MPFEAVARAGAWSMMAAYNLVNDVHCSQNGAFIGGILREEIGWDGVLMSDWEATHDTVPDATAGLDLEMPGPPRFLGPALAAAVRRGEVAEEILNTAALHVLTLATRVGALPLNAEIGAAAPGSVPVAGNRPETAASEPLHLSDPDAASLVRRAAAESFVLLSNDGTLPLAPAKLRKVAVLGPNAAAPCIQGSGAAHVDEPYAVSPLDGLRAALPETVAILQEAAPSIGRFLPPLAAMDLTDLDGNRGLTIEFFRGQKLAGTPAARYNVRSSELELFGDLPAGLPQNDFSGRVAAWLTPAVTGTYKIAMRAFSKYRETGRISSGFINR